MKRLLTLVVVIAGLASCGKTGANIPNVGVNFEASTTDPRLSALNVPGGAVLINGYGVAGLVLYRQADGSYSAYDRCSTVNPQNRCAVTLNSGNFIVTDPCTGAEWELLDGSPVKAPATISLRSYNIVVSNFEIYVTN